jgi:KaiC/GvpD/RAD55 family RecA-like ATPase
MEKLRVGIPGLDLVLGGGIPLVRRSDEGPESAIILLRGPPGSGKSVFGTQLAGAVARELRCDVAYGCVELSPQELREQHASFGRNQESVLRPPFPKQQPPTKGSCRIFAALLDLGEEEGSERASFGGAVIELLDVVKQVGGDPRVLVIDSLSDGYGLGASVPRILADQLCKVAVERGMILILLEETVDAKPSPWSFASDIVVGLEVQAEDQAPDMPAPFERRLMVTKNRFAPSDAGPHRFTVDPERGVVLFPRPSAYMAPWAQGIVLPDAFEPLAPSQGWGALINTPESWPQFRDSVTTVYGSDPAYVFRVASSLGTTASGTECPGTDVFVDFGRGAREPSDNEYMIAAANPFLSGNRLLAMTVEALDKVKRSCCPLRRVLLGDLGSIQSFWNPDGLRRAVGVLLTVLRRAGIPAVLFETTPVQHVFDIPHRGLMQVGEGPSIFGLADVNIEVNTKGYHTNVVVTDVRGGRRYPQNLAPLDS